jgi:glycosyltransferase involved in cell wall biosynthesis
MKVLKLCKMLKMRDHTVLHLGHEDSIVDCDEHVTVTTQADLEASYPGHDWRTQGFPDFKLTDPIYAIHTANAVAAIKARQQPGDFLLCPWGAGNKPVADNVSDLIVCESGIGYAGGTFAPYKVYESYAVMHGLYGAQRVGSMFTDAWYDCVIPNAFDPDDFTFSAEKHDYLLFLGRVGPGKGTNIAVQIAEATGHRLIVAGPGRVQQADARTDRPIDEYVTHLGVVGPEMRAGLLARAKAVLCPSTYLEPFCGVMIEAALSGTPVISTDWGAFAENLLHGVTGFRCRTFEHFTFAVRNIDRIDPRDCRVWAAANFSLERVAAMYDEYFDNVAKIYGGRGGWYAENAERQNLDWLKRTVPGG